MKSINTYFALLIVFAVMLGHHTAIAQLNGGIKAGFNLNSIRLNYTNSNEEPALLPDLGFHVGIVLEKPLNENGSFVWRPELLLTGKGFSYNLKQNLGDDAKGYDRNNLSYLEIPMTFVYKSAGGFQINAGPYVALATGGKRKWDYEVGDVAYTGTIDYLSKFGERSAASFGDEEAGIYALDYGATVGIGYQVNASVFTLSYSLGLSNISPKLSDINREDYQTYNSNLSFSVIWLMEE